jgi:hypothetical protein
MQRALLFVLGAAVVVLAVILMVKSSGPGMGAATTHAAIDAGGDGGARAAASGDGGGSGSSTAGGPSPFLGDGDVLLPIVSPYETPPDGGVGYTMPDGTPVPPLPADAPRQVKVGVILFQYQGGQLAPPNARTKDEAKALADKTAPDAKLDFHAGVQKGDSGFSFDDAGIIYRGSLEPAIEYAVFSLKVGDVSDPIDTPRGYWIVKRIE